MKKQIEQLSAYEPGLSPRALKENYGIKGELHKLASNENLYGPSPKVKEAIQAHLDELQYYPETGSPLIKEAISKHLNIDPARILFGAGLDEVILMISRAVLTPGDKIVTSEMTFGQYYHNAIVESANVVQVPLQNGEFDLDGILSEIDNDTKLVWLCNPNNPTGRYFTHDALRNFLERVPSHIPVIVDEAYVEFATAKDFPDTLALQQEFENAFLLRTFSKAYGLAGMRIGYVIAAKEAIEKYNIIRPPFNVGRLSEYAALAALEDQEYLASIRERNAEEREKFFELSQSDHFYPSQTNFVFVKTDKPHELYEALLNVGCITREFPNGVRITIGFPEQNAKMREVLAQFTL
ncbi:histidinol-phosphate aminotransferase [Staphylococcus saprophyticus]|jgi:histidinol-phosphate aminotransferase|uniref:Histidinol-phosphate aminotransferase n=2 Tax=Staphylococcus TaxID=1279 RepID=HIS8_STAS1|nr:MULTISPECIES: histidinol-phosphate transaminase [Staphylococcus]Q49VS0.1 RecName: Full=Histidinol-phosphate aminotransferase; AltName: Full=Imidazole acetol-phosphate transaminase [Staphylococcus saprophyticus subsp. saprophyticus ATCC 15305 = NCTC 7292]AMG34115.1 histidinol-phosphate transaminase [Staphylococcus saprophyticus]ASE57749.1 histidinol-phosphate transaminase [Staphylococcus saprophyticus]ASF18778.1 histidinol-phosphate transaminase [Staphylococcus saprophyticus]MBC2921461.1 his